MTSMSGFGAAGVLMSRYPSPNEAFGPRSLDSGNAAKQALFEIQEGQSLDQRALGVGSENFTYSAS
jgi:hypothetical protein